MHDYKINESEIREVIHKKFIAFVRKCGQIEYFRVYVYRMGVRVLEVNGKFFNLDDKEEIENMCFFENNIIGEYMEKNPGQNIEEIVRKIKFEFKSISSVIGVLKRYGIKLTFSFLENP